jgi:hypothetical protein
VEELHLAAAGSAKQQIDLKHPYPFASLYTEPSNTISQMGGGEVRVYNCKQIFNTYCSMALGSSLQPKKHLFIYAAGQQNDNDACLIGVRYPTPVGWQTKDTADYDVHWNGVDMNLVFSSDRVKRKSVPERYLMCFVFLVVVQLREEGFLDENNRPKKALLPHMKRKCPLDAHFSDAIRIKNTVFQTHNL